MSGHAMADEQDVCWICFEGSLPEHPLERPCSCPRSVHKDCLARWCLQSGGKEEERHCRFCKQQLPDWKNTLQNGSKQVTPYMRVSFNGKTHKVAVKPGQDGQKEFAHAIRKLLALPEDQEFDVIFHCRAPGSGDKLQLQGLCAFDAAVHCASMTSSTSARHTMPKAQRGAEGGSAVQRVVQRVASRLLTMLPSHHSDSLQAAT